MRAGGVVVRCGVANVRDWKPRPLYLTRTWAAQAADVVRELRGLPVPLEARLDLITLIAGMDNPRGRNPGCLLLVSTPTAGRTTTDRARGRRACPGRDKGVDRREKGGLCRASRPPIDQILDKADHDIRVRGPLWWTVGETAADARRGYPWVGLPSGGIHAMGNVQHDARGVLVIENADTFQQVCMHCPEITDRWLCVWGKGSATSGVVAFLELMSDVPIAVWGDLDATGSRS